MKKILKAMFLCHLVCYFNYSQAQEQLLLGTRKGSIREGKIITFDSGKIEFASNFNTPHAVSVSSSLALNQLNEVVLYTNGCFLYNGSHEAISDISLQDGSGFDCFCSKSGTVFPKSTMFVPVPGSMTDWYLFYIKGAENIVDSTQSLIMIRINIEHELIVQTKTISAIKPGHFDIGLNDNGMDYWLTFIDEGKKSIQICLIHSEGISLKNEYPLPLTQNNPNCVLRVDCQFSPQFDRLIIHSGECFLSVFDFDACSGELYDMRLNTTTSSTSLGGEANFSFDGKYIFLHKDIYIGHEPFLSGNSEIQIFNVEKIGVSVRPEKTISVPANFSMGRIIQSDNNILIFNRFSDAKYLNLHIHQYNPLNIESEFVETPYWYYPSFSRQIKKNNNIDKCISSSQENISLSSFVLFPNPASNEAYLDFDKPYLGKELTVNIFDDLGRQWNKIILCDSDKTIDVSNLMPGLYIIEIIDNSGFSYLKKLFVFR